MKLVITINKDLLNLPKLRRALGRLSLYGVDVSVDNFLSELLIMDTERYAQTSMPLEFTEGLAVNMFEFISKDIDTSNGFYYAAMELEEYVNFFENNIEIKGSLGDLRNSLNNNDYYVKDILVRNFKHMLIAYINLENDKPY